MATYSPAALKIQPPKTGFQVGGWYSGRQYWNGTLGEPGQIHPESNQPGAGAAVNPAVVAATNVQQGLKPGTNEAYIASQIANAPKVAPAQPSAVASPTNMPTASTGTPGGGSLSLPAPATINLPQIYEGFYAKSGISEIESELSSRTKAYNEAVNKINDNPYYSEATRVGRIAKLDDKFNRDTAALRNDIATKKADIETKINLETKQFDINSEAAKTAFSQFQALLTAGALDNASGEDIANITRSTGLSSAMIYSAVNAQKQKDVQTSVIQYDDGTDQGFMVINSNTGEIIKKDRIAPSKPKAASASDKKEADAQANQQNAIGDIQRGVTLRDLINHYAVAGGLSVEDLYRLYNSYSPYGTAKEDIEDVKEGKFAS